MDDLRERLLDYIDRERRFAWRDYLELQDMEVETRVERGMCVSGVHCTKEGVFTYSENFSKFRRGEFVFVNEGHPIGEEIRTKGVKASIKEFHPERNEFIIDPDKWRPTGFDDLTGKKNLTIDTRNEDFLTGRLKKSVNTAFDGTNSTAKKIRSILKGSFKESPNDKNKRKAQSYLKDLDLLPKQEETFTECFRRSFKLIQGPPGTGKTYLLAHVVSALAMSGKKILVTAYTHRAINNVLNMVVKKTDCGNVAKLGDGRGEDLDEQVGEVVDHENGCIIGATVFKAYKEYGLEDYFDVVVFDEAG
ncbi:MAG: AAA family ATPase, partial [Deltaproteobacteria bacterium]|nr:AAA family ATPase [Deltaproteobacteria bacterium]